MKIKYSPVHTDNQETVIEYVDENTIMIDYDVYEFDPESVEWPDIAEQTVFRILGAHRDEKGELWLVVRRFYTQLARPDWDTGDYHEVSRKD
ncbi:TPA: hypothetical protein ENX78_08480 [Candidatus Poribacteria bacterium]|nr:hypothetical protein [Candidatus Poribacteria bacterium]